MTMLTGELICALGAKRDAMRRYARDKALDPEVRVYGAGGPTVGIVDTEIDSDCVSLAVMADGDVDVSIIVEDIPSDAPTQRQLKDSAKSLIAMIKQVVIVYEYLKAHDVDADQLMRESRVSFART